MRKWITLLMTCLVAGSVSYANANVGQVDFEAGYRRDNISWKLRAPSDDPVVSTSHRFKDLDIFQIGLNGRTTIGCNFYLRANAYWGWILDGEFERHVETSFSDYGCGCDDFEFGFNSHAKTTIDDQYVYGVGAAIGYPFYFCDCSAIIAPVIGYAFDQQNIKVENVQFNGDFRNESCYSDYYSSCSEESCCDQSFHNKWYGPFVGVDFNYQPCNACWNVYADIEYHWGNFTGHRSGLDGFNSFDRHDRKSNEATAWVFALGGDYALCDCWTIGFSLKFQDWAANRHHRQNDSADDDFFGYGERCCNDRVKTNHKWHSYAINLTVGHDF